MYYHIFEFFRSFEKAGKLRSYVFDYYSSRGSDGTTHKNSKENSPILFDYTQG